MKTQIEDITTAILARLSDKYLVSLDEDYRREVARQLADDAAAYHRTGWTRQDYNDLNISVWRAAFYAGRHHAKPGLPTGPHSGKEN